MNTLILAAGRFDEDLKTQIAADREPRLDVFELCNRLGADFIDFREADRSRAPQVRALRRALGPSAAVAYLGWKMSDRYDALFTTGEDIGIPLAALMRTRRRRCSHTMIAHTLSPGKKGMFFRWLDVGSRIDRILCYSTSEERHIVDRLHVPSDKVERIYFHSDDHFFKPVESAPEPDLICAAGQLLRDYDTLVEAVRDLPVRVQIAAGSPWIERPLEPKRTLPANISWQRLSRYELRSLYRRSALAVVPIFQNDYQTGIATILEMMAAGKCVVATRTRGQTDTIVDGVTGLYVPPGDPTALRSVIVRMLEQPQEAAKIGQNARRFVAEHASLDRFVDRVAQAIQVGHGARLAA
jgi:glycosyltransferase involved in cell wall biosynthesis